MTLPLILLRDEAGQPDVQRLQALYEESDATHSGMLVDWLEESGALQQARRTAGEVRRRGGCRTIDAA